MTVWNTGRTLMVIGFAAAVCFVLAAVALWKTWPPRDGNGGTHGAGTARPPATTSTSTFPESAGVTEPFPPLGDVVSPPGGSSDSSGMADATRALEAIKPSDSVGVVTFDPFNDVHESPEASIRAESSVTDGEVPPAADAIASYSPVTQAAGQSLASVAGLPKVEKDSQTTNDLDAALAALERTRRVRNLESELQAADFGRRETAVLALANIGEPAVPYLFVALTDDDVLTRGIAAEALARLGPQAASAAEALANSLADDNPEVRRLSTIALGRTGPAAASVADLVRRHGTGDKFEALFRIQRNVEPLISGLSHSDARVRAPIVPSC